MVNVSVGATGRPLKSSVVMRCPIGFETSIV
jgi:hypothetical protein